MRKGKRRRSTIGSATGMAEPAIAAAYRARVLAGFEREGARESKGAKKREAEGGRALGAAAFAPQPLTASVSASRAAESACRRARSGGRNRKEDPVM
jgi:hypothetical protein